MTQGRTAPGVREATPALLDVVVLGGGGHVGLPLSLVVRRRRLAGRHLRHQRADARADRAGRMPFLENGADAAAARVLATGSPRAQHRRRDHRPRRRRDRRHRHARGRVPQPVDARVRAGRRPDRAAPPRRRPRRPPQHGLPGHDRVRRGGARRPRHAASTSRSAPSGSPRATRSRSSRTLPQIIGADDDAAGGPRRGAVRPARRQDASARRAGGRAGQAVHEHLAVHEVRRREPVLHDRRPGRASTTRTSCARSARTTRGPRTCRAPGSPPARACSRTRCSWRPSPTDHFPLGQAAMQINEGLPAYIVSALERRHGSLRGRTVGILGMAFKAESDDTARRSASSSASSSSGPARASSAPTRTSTTSASSRSTRSSPAARSSSSAPRTAPTASSTSAGREVVDIWNATGDGIRL